MWERVMSYSIHPDKVYLVVFAIFMVGAGVKYSAEVVCDAIWETEVLDMTSVSLASPAGLVTEATPKYDDATPESDHI